MRTAGFVPIEAKLRPPAAPGGLVLRGRLVDRLLQAAATPVVLVTAPPGYGKSVVVSQWAGEDDRPFAWLTLDAADNDPVVLVTYLLLALHGVEPVDAGFLDALDAEGEWDVAVVLPRLRAVLRHRRPFVLVLDDVDALTSSGSLAVLGTLAQALPEGAQLVLVGRTAPPLDWGVLGAGRRLVDFGSEDLRLSHDEGGALVQATGLRLSEAEVDELLRRTEGWAAGMYLATLPSSSTGSAGTPGGLPAPLGSDTLIAEYLRDQLLEGLTGEDQSFLIRTSVLSVLSGPLCDAVLSTRGSEETLHRLAGSNVLLVPVDDEDRWFRLHQLFAEALRGELQRREPQLVKGLHARASRWFETNGELEQAVPHAVAAGDVARAARLIWHQTPSCLATGRAATLEGWLDRFPPRQVGAHAKLALTAAWCAVQRGRPAEHWIAAAERGHYDAALAGEAESVAAGTALLRAVVARNGLTQMAADAQLAVRLQGPDGPWLATAELLQAVATYLTGHAAQARTLLEAVVRLAGEVHAYESQAVALGELALMALDERDLATAESLTSRASALVRQHGLEDVATVELVPCLGALLAAERGRREEAGALVRRCLRLVALTGHPAPWGGVQCREVLARAQLLLGDPTAARTLLSEAQGLLADIPDGVVLRSAVEQVWRRIAQIPLDAAGGASTLTSAELRVLQFLPTHLSFEEIGRELFVSRNTVKTQAVAAYRKLGVSSRSEAVERARALGILGP